MDKERQEQKEKKCGKCGIPLSSMNAYQFKDKSLSNLCKDCEVEEIDFLIMESYLPLFKKFDIPFVGNTWDGIRLRNSEYSSKRIFGIYLNTMKLHDWRVYGFKDSLKLYAYECEHEQYLREKIKQRLIKITEQLNEEDNK